MSRIRSPGYPSISLGEAIDLVRKIFDRNRHNALDREAAVKEMGFTGITGHSSKMLADLGHYGLIAKEGKGSVKVTPLSARILHPHDPQERTSGLQEAAYHPELFFTIKERWPDGFVSENALNAYLIRNGFASAALQHAIKAYMATYAFLQEEGATESHRHSSETEPESVPSSDRSVSRDLVPVPLAQTPPTQTAAPASRTGVELMAGERVVFVEESTSSQYLKLIASGEISADMLEALEDFVKRQKKRIEKTKAEEKPADIFG